MIPRAKWTVLLIGGSSGVGKTRAAKQFGRHLGVPWLQVDDLRLSLQRSLAHLLPEQTLAALDFFDLDKHPTVWQLPPEQICQGLIDVGETMLPALEVVLENHIDTDEPLVVEGDGILPALLARPSTQSRRAGVRAVFLVEPEESSIFANIMERKRGMRGQTEAEVQVEARGKWLYGQWLAGEARQHGFPVLEPHPWSTLLERIVARAALTLALFIP